MEVDGEPLGIAGSGLISAVAEMLRRGMISPDGRMSRELGGSLTLVERPKKIEITQKDVREVQKAVAAVYSAWRILLNRANLTVRELKGIYLAGTFGSHLEPADAIDLGLIPPVNVDDVVSLGNAALSGAKALLLSEEALETARELYLRVIHESLADDPSFADIFVEGTFLSRRAPS